MFNFIERLEKVEEEVFGYNHGSFPREKSLRGQVDGLLDSNKKLRGHIDLLESQLDLIYIPASEEKKEARYEEKPESSISSAWGLIGSSANAGLPYVVSSGTTPTQKIKKTKKK